MEVSIWVGGGIIRKGVERKNERYDKVVCSWKKDRGQADK
jgi:hypothetical protein